MVLKILCKGKSDLLLNIGNKCTVAAVIKKLINKKKFIVFRRFPIHPSYVRLRYKDRFLTNEDIVHDGQVITICISITWKTGENIQHTTVLDYNSTAQELIKICCDTMNLTDIILTCSNKGVKPKCIRKYLHIKGIIFSAVRTKESRLLKKLLSICVKNHLENARDISDKYIKIDCDSTIDNLRRVVADEFRINICKFNLYLDDKRLINGNLIDHNLKNNATLVIKSLKLPKNLDEQFIINVINNVNNSEQKYMIDELQTVEKLKLILRDQYNVKVECISLLIDGNECDNASVIRDMGIESGSSIVLRLLETPERKVIEEIISIVIVNGLGEKYGGVKERLSVCDGDSVELFWEKIKELFSVSDVEFEVSYKGEIMKRNNMISTYNICEGSEIMLSGSVLVRYFVGGSNSSAKVNRYVFAVQDTVAQLKERITKKLNLDARFINLTFNGNALQDQMKLEEAGVENGSYLMMISTLAGGGTKLLCFNYL